MGKSRDRAFVIESPSADVRLERAASFVNAQRSGRVTITAASIESASEVARRALLSGKERASLGWQRTTLGVLAAALARPELARRGLVPAGSLALEAMCTRVVHDHAEKLGRFLPIKDRPGLPRALARTLNELRMAGITKVPDADLGRLLVAFEEELSSAGLADRAQTFTLATAAAEAMDPKELGALLLVDVSVRSKAEHDFVAALAKRASAVLALVPTGDGRSLELTKSAMKSGSIEEARPPDSAPPSSTIDRLHGGLFGDALPASQSVDDAEVTVLSAPGESRECVEIARLVLKEAATQGTPFDRMAVLLRAPQYGAHLAEAFRRAKVPAHFAKGTRKPDPGGRALLALIACAAEKLSASRFAEYLSLGEVPEDDAEGAPPKAPPRAERVAPPAEEALGALLGSNAAAAHEETQEPAEPKGPIVAEEDQATAFGTLKAPRHWERLLVDAAVIGGKDRWIRRLDGLANKLKMDVAAYLAKGEDVLAEGVNRDVRALESLRRFALPLIDDLDALPKGRAYWGEWLELLSRLATRAIRHPDRVLAVLGELEPMAKVGPVSIAEVRLVLEPRLSQLLVRSPGRRHGKVLVATIEEARGMAFDVVFVPGLAEKIFPQKVVEDPLLLDDIRRTSLPELATNELRTEDERLLLRLAVGAAKRRVVLTYPRLDVEQARPRTPSFYGLEVLRIAEGTLRDFEYLAKKAADRADARIGWPAPRNRDDAIDEAEFDLAVLDEILKKEENEAVGQAHYLLHTNDHLARALRFRGRRWLPAWKASDGLVDPPGEALAAIREHMTEKRSFSPTALQNFAACPYRFLLSAVHKLAPREEPAAIEDLDPLTRGSLVHEVQFKLLTKLREENLLPIRNDTLETARNHLDTVLDEVAREYHDQLNPAIERVWLDAMASIAADLREWLHRMSKEPEWMPAHFELSFGLKDPRDQDKKSTDEPVKLDEGLLLRGSIDLVEQRAGGFLRATDHKTGKVKAKKDSVISGGEILQPVLYALVLEKLFPRATVESGVLYYCTAAGGFEQVPVPLDEEARNAARAMAKTISEAIAVGFLPAAPNKDAKGYSACTWCDFKGVCGPYEEIRTKKKPPQRLKSLIELRRQR